jgi:hypothetical protein
MSETLGFHEEEEEEEGYSTRDYGGGLEDDEFTGDEEMGPDGTEYAAEEDDLSSSSGYYTSGYSISPAPKSEYHIYTTELGERFRLKPSEQAKRGAGVNGYSGERFGDQHIGIERKQRTLSMRPPEHPGGRAIWDPITEDGYLDPAERDDPTIAPYRVDYVRELLQRGDILRSHPDYEFLSQFASHLSLLPEDVYVEETVTRKQAAASALLEAITARRQARAVQFQDVGKRIEGLQAERLNKQSELDFKTGSLLPGDVDTARVLLIEFDRHENNMTQANQFRDFLGVMKSMITEDSPLRITNDEKALNAIENYLTEISPNGKMDMTQRMVRHYKRYKSDPDLGIPVKLAFLLYAASDFLSSLGATYARAFIADDKEAAFLGTTGLTGTPEFGDGPLALKIPRPKGIGWKAIDVTVVPESVASDPDERGDFGTIASPGDRADRFASKLLDVLFAPNTRNNNLDILASIRKGEYLRTPDSFSNPGRARKISTYINTLQDQYQRLRAMFAAEGAYGPDPDGGRSFTIEAYIDRLEDIAIRTAVGDVQAAVDTSSKMYRLLNRGSVQPSLDALGLVKELGLIQDAIVLGAGRVTSETTKPIAEVTRRWVVTIVGEQVRLQEEVRSIEAAIEELRRRIDALRRTGRAPGEPEVDVPFRTSLEWALKPINTGEVVIAPWATSAINKGHAQFKVYVARGRTARWRDIERKTLQRDELMGPLFAEFCAMYVEKAKIANPRRYMRASAGAELKLRKASVVKSMQMDLSYVARARTSSDPEFEELGRGKFVPRHSR